jgi:SAM-dependent methyltransferase
LEEELRVRRFEAWVIRASGLVFSALARLLDLLALAFRPRLLRAYFAVWWAELLESPYRWPRSFDAVMEVKASRQRLRELMYGEAPVFTSAWLLWRAGVRKGSRVLDLGAGRGRVLIGARWLGAGATGLELHPPHVQAVAPALARIGAALLAADAMEADWGQPTHVFLNWCAFSDETKKRIIERLAALPEGTRAIAVTRPIEDPRFRAVSRHRCLFTWGTERAWVHELRGERQ